MANSVSVEVIVARIYQIRGKRVMLDSDLAELYGVETKALVQAVKRNSERFPDDFMWQLKAREFTALRSQFVTSKRGGRRYLPYVFTEQGVAMLSSVLNSTKAIQVNIQIMRAFTYFRRMLLTHKDLKRKIEEMEDKYDKQFAAVFEAIKRLLEQPKAEEKRIIGFAKR
ncbi:MAG: ORF6N domain-containing protein [Candidatus Omnitrophota bacterium]